MKHNSAPSIPSRRTVVRTAAWTVPAVAVATATPAFADSEAEPVWSITSNSWEALTDSSETRNDIIGIAQFNFTIAVPASVALGTVYATVQFITGNGRAGAHVKGYITTTGASRTHGDWSLHGSNRGDYGSSYLTFTFQRSTTTKATASILSLSFNTSAMMDDDVQSGSSYATITFSSTNKTNAPDRVFRILPRNNAAGQIAVPI